MTRRLRKPVTMRTGTVECAGKTEGPGGSGVLGEVGGFRSSGEERGAHAAYLVLPAAASWVTALVLLGRPAATGAVVAALTAVGALAVALLVRTGRTAGRRNAVIAVLGCTAAVAGSVAFRVHAAGTGPVAELAGRHASAVMEVVVTDDPREVARRGGCSGGRASWCPPGSSRSGRGRAG